MRIENIHIFKPHSFKAAVQGRSEIFRRTVLVAVRAAPHIKARLGGNTQLTTIGSQPIVKYPAEILLSSPVVRASVAVGQVKAAYTAVKSGVNHLLHIVKGAFRAEILPQPQRQSGHFQPALPASAIFFFIVSFFVWGVH